MANVYTKHFHTDDRILKNKTINYVFYSIANAKICDMG